MKRFAMITVLLLAAAAPSLAETYYWGEIQVGGNVWIDGWGDWGEVGYWYDDYYVHADGFGDWLWIDEVGDIWVDGRLWGYMNPFGDVYCDDRGYLFTIEYDPGADEFFHDGIYAFDAQTVFFVLAFEEKFFGWEAGLFDIFTFNQPPDALIRYEKVGSFDLVQFTADVLDLDGEIVEVYWEFGDGTSSSDFDPLHGYGRDGKFWVTLTAWDDGGAWDSASLYLRIKSRPPKARFKRKTIYSVPGKVQFFDKSKDRDGAIVSWAWEFGDGATSDERSPIHIYPSPGYYFATLTVTDSDGEIGVRVKRIKVKFKGGR